jgi:hypothetical protein
MKTYRFIKPDPNLQSNLMAFGYSCNMGWYPIIEELFDKLSEIVDDGFEVLQVKEKWGTLNIYVNYGSDEIFELIRLAEKKSEITCEDCGKPGTMGSYHGWYSVRCTECREKYEADSR